MWSIKNSLLIKSALNWLMKQQAGDGGWHENPEIKLPEWMMWESAEKRVTWYTNRIAELLHELEMTKTEQFEKHRRFSKDRKGRREDGAYSGRTMNWTLTAPQESPNS